MVFLDETVKSKQSHNQGHKQKGKTMHKHEGGKKLKHKAKKHLHISNISHDSLSRVSSKSHDSDGERTNRKDFLKNQIDLNPPVINVIGKIKAQFIRFIIITNRIEQDDKYSRCRD